jgi:hypothetical protein
MMTAAEHCKSSLVPAAVATWHLRRMRLVRCLSTWLAPGLLLLRFSVHAVCCSAIAGPHSPHPAALTCSWSAAALTIALRLMKLLQCPSSRLHNLAVCCDGHSTPVCCSLPLCKLPSAFIDVRSKFCRETAFLKPCLQMPDRSRRLWTQLEHRIRCTRLLESWIACDDQLH